MERLTEKHYLGTDHYMKCSGSCNVDMDCIDCPSFDCLVERLAAYEDIGLEPEQCETAKTIIESVFSDDTSKAERIRELLKADSDGRLVVIPHNKVLTNADRMRTATNQQLAKQLYDNQKEFCRILYKKLGLEDELNFSEDYSDILAWLNAPSKEAEKVEEADERAEIHQSH